MSLTRAGAFVCAIVCASVSPRAASEEAAADWVLEGGKIFTALTRAPWAEAVAIRDGRFVYVGDAAGAARFIGASTRVTDLARKLVIPGIVDGHTHPGYIGIESYGRPWLPTTSKADIVKAVRTYARAHPGTGWIRMCCWPERLLYESGERPNRHDLDAVAGDRPVWLTSSVWHAVWVNSKALEVLGVSRDTPDPRPGLAQFLREPDGAPNGLITEGAAWQFGVSHFPVDAATHEKEVRRLVEFLSARGVVALFDGGNFGHEDRVYSLLAKLDREGHLPLRYEGTYQIFLPEQRRDAIAQLQRLRERYGSERLRFDTIKLFMDGVIADHTAAMLAPYADDTHTSGNTMMSADELADFLLELDREHLNLHVHAIGDRAVRTVLDGVELARGRLHRELYPRITLAHLGLVDEADFARIAALGIIADYTPQWHGVVENDPVRHALGTERYARTFLVRPLLDAGGIVSFSSDDWTVYDQSPFLGIEVGHRRAFPATRTPAGAQSAAAPIRGPATEQLDLETMVRGYTINGAYQLRMEDEIGSIEVGKRADLAILDQNLFEIDPAHIHSIVPSAVVVDGVLLHGALH